MPIFDFRIPPDLESDRDLIVSSLGIIPVFLDWLTQKYCLTGELPSIEVRPSDGIEAFASDQKITITTGVIYSAVRAARATRLDAECVDYLSKTHPKFSPSLLFLLWVVGHEFFHIARGHHQVLDSFPGTERLLEYDADCMASAALFRFLRGSSAVASETHSLSLRTTYYSIFWPIRAEIGSSISFISSPTHPHWAIRLYYTLLKISTLWNGRPPTNYADLVCNHPSPEMMHEARCLAECAFGWEHQYLQEQGGIIIEKNAKYATPLIHEFHDMTRNKLHPLYSMLSEWEHLSTEVEKASRLQSF